MLGFYCEKLSDSFYRRFIFVLISFFSGWKLFYEIKLFKFQNNRDISTDLSIVTQAILFAG